MLRRRASPSGLFGTNRTPRNFKTGSQETALLPGFLTDIFCGLLGYTGPAESGETFTFSRERHVEVDGKVAYAVLGRFQKDKEQFVAVLEGNGARDPLDRPFGGRRLTQKSNVESKPRACGGKGFL